MNVKADVKENILELFKKAGEKFCDGVKDFQEIIEIGLVGSAAGVSNCPGDLDIFVILDNFKHIEDISSIARKIYGQKHVSMDVFFLSKRFDYFGRICLRKDCPADSVECGVPGCGDVKHIKRVKGFVFDKRRMLESPVSILYSAGDIFLKERKRYNITDVRKYEPLEDITLECIECGEDFVFSVGEQKVYEERGFNRPKRCEECREVRKNWDLGGMD